MSYNPALWSLDFGFDRNYYCIYHCCLILLLYFIYYILTKEVQQTEKQLYQMDFYFEPRQQNNCSIHQYCILGYTHK